MVVVVPSHGNGTCTEFHEYHFELQDGRRELRFASIVPRASYLTEEPKLKGRYQIEQFECAALGGTVDSWTRTRWFWSGEGYLPAFVVRSEAPDRRRWIEENRSGFESAERPRPPAGWAAGGGALP